MMKKSNYTTLLFDLDGTLVDSGEGIMKCAQYSLAHFGIEVTDLQTLRPFVGPPLEDSYKMLYGFNDEDAKKAVQIYRERYFSKGWLEQHLYHGVLEFLEELRQRNYVMGIATSKMQIQADKVTREFGLIGFLQCFDYKCFIIQKCSGCHHDSGAFLCLTHKPSKEGSSTLFCVILMS